MNHLGLSFGLMTISLKDQLAEQGFKLGKKDLRIAVKLCDSVNWLGIHGMVSDSEIDKVRKKILRFIAKKVFVNTRLKRRRFIK